MRAIRVHEFGGPEVLRLDDAPVPELRSGEIRVRMHAAGVNPVDTYIRAGGYGQPPRLPWTPGFDGAGVVDALGEGAMRFKVGDRVFLDGNRTGTYAEFAVGPQRRAHLLPEKISFAIGACVGVPYGTAYRALVHRARVTPGESVLVNGASGGVGLAAIQWARALGARVIGTAGTTAGRALVAREGAHHVLAHDDFGRRDPVLALTENRGVDVIIEMLANVNLQKDLDVLAPHGRIVVIGSRGRIEVDPRAAMVRDASIMGMALANLVGLERESVYEAVGAGLEAGFLRPVLRAEVPLADAARAHELVMEPGARGKIVLAV